MKKGCLRVIGNAILVALSVAVITAAAGWFLGWRTALQFSNGLFWAGAIVIVLGLLSIIGGQGVRANIGMLYSESAGDRLSDRMRGWAAGLTEDYGTLVYLLLSGGILLLLSALVDTLTGSSK